jgi:hypothetical protein
MHCEAAAFPGELAGIATSLAAALLPAALPHGASLTFSVVLDDRPLAIPYRVYYDQAQLLLCTERAGMEGLVAQCLGTRHHDGFVRERCARALLTQDADIRVPFLVQLLGEYVLEIILPIRHALSGPLLAACAHYLHDNPRYKATLERRATSYWSCYYRHRYPVLADYPAMQVVRQIDAARAVRIPE